MKRPAKASERKAPSPAVEKKKPPDAGSSWLGWVLVGCLLLAVLVVALCSAKKLPEPVEVAPGVFSPSGRIPIGFNWKVGSCLCETALTMYDR
jgi:hypothetical protein